MYSIVRGGLTASPLVCYTLLQDERITMFSIETEFDYTVITSLDERGNFEDVEVVLDEEVVYLAQAMPKSDKRQVLELTYQQFIDIVLALDLPDGAYYAREKDTYLL